LGPPQKESIFCLRNHKFLELIIIIIDKELFVVELFVVKRL